VRAVVAGRGRQTPAVAAILEETVSAHKLDFLRFIDVDSGRRMAAEWPVVAAALAGSERTETEIFTEPQLAAISPLLASRAATPLIATPNAVPTERAAEERGLVIHSAAPVHDAAGNLLGVLEGGVLLNKNLDFIDNLNAVVYPDGTLPLGSAGTATLFLGDVRVATNVRLFGDTRAIGTRVSAVVNNAVLKQGVTWLDSAFVVSDWYVSAYAPLVDSRQQRIGMLYVGFLEAPFAKARWHAFYAVAAFFVLAMLLAGAYAVLSARRVFKPSSACMRR